MLLFRGFKITSHALIERPLSALSKKLQTLHQNRLKGGPVGSFSKLATFAEAVSPEPYLSQDIGQENLMLPSGSSSSTSTTTHADPPRKAAARK
jgi:hypothetical protein